MSKTLLALGDSWTDPNYPYYYDYKVETWDSKLAKKLGYNLVNRGKSAASNEKIVKMAIDYLSHNPDPDLICVVWSEQHRVDFYNYLNLIPFNVVWNNRTGERLDCNENTSRLLNPEAIFDQIINKGNDKYVPNEYFRNLWTLQYIADTKGIPIYHAQGVHAWSKRLYEHNLEKSENGKNLAKGEWKKLFHSWKRFMKLWVESDYFQEFDQRESNMIGWPFFRDLGGYSLNAILDDNLHRIPDGHPNNEGMEIIANAFLKKIKV